MSMLFGIAHTQPFIYGVWVMKKTILLIFCLCAISSRGQHAGTQPAPSSLTVDGYAARVNDRVITSGEVHEALTPMLPDLYRTYQGDELEEHLEKAYERILNQLIERVLIMEAFKARGGQIPEQYVEDEIKRVISTRFKGDKALFEQVLAEQKKTREEYKEILREQMAVGMLTSEEVSRRARITPKQVRDEYIENKDSYFIPEKVKHSVIVLNKGTTAEDQAVKIGEATKIRQRLLEGADFGETAKEVSEGSRAAEGGAFPWMQPKDVRFELQEILNTLPAGEISEIIETDQQLYIVKVEARRQPGHKNFDEVRKEIKKILVAKERERLRARWIERLKRNHYIVIYD